MSSKFFGNSKDNKVSKKGKSQSTSARTNKKRLNANIKKSGRGR